MHNVDTTLMHSEPGIEKYYMQGGKQWQLLSAAFVKNTGCGWVVHGSGGGGNNIEIEI